MPPDLKHEAPLIFQRGFFCRGDLGKYPVGHVRPYAALHVSPRQCGGRKSTPHSSVFLRLASGAFCEAADFRISISLLPIVSPSEPWIWDYDSRTVKSMPTSPILIIPFLRCIRIRRSFGSRMEIKCPTANLHAVRSAYVNRNFVIQFNGGYFRFGSFLTEFSVKVSSFK